MLMFQAQPEPEKKPKKKRKSERPDSSGMLYFILSFVICLVIFIGIGVIWWKVTDPDLSFLSNPKTTTTTTEVQQSSSRFGVNDRFSVAVYITDDQKKLQTVSIALFKPDADSVSVIPMLAELALPDSDSDTLARRFATGGASAAQLALSGYIGKELDYYIVMSYKDVENYLTQLGTSLIMKLPKDVDQQATDGSFSIHLDAGEQALSPKQTANLLRCDNWQNGMRERANMHAAVVSAYINEFIDSNRDLSSDHAMLMTNSTTSLNNERFGSAQPKLSYLASLNRDFLCTSINLDGYFTGAGDTLRFTPDATTIELLQMNMK